MKNIKIIAFLLAVFMIVPFALASCDTGTSTTSSTASSKATSSAATSSAAATSVTSEESGDALVVPASIKKAGKINMATNAYFPPYEFIDKDGKFAGIDVEIMQAIADLWKVELVVNNMEFDSILAAIKTGQADIGAAGMTITEERLKEVTFSYTYATATQVIIVKEGSSITGADSLAGKKVGVQIGTTGDIYATSDAEAKKIGSVERYDNGITAVLALTQDKVDAVIIDNEPAKIFVQKNEGLKIIDEAYTNEQYAMAIAKENTELVNAINAALDVLEKNGTLEKIITKYIPVDSNESAVSTAESK